MENKETKKIHRLKTWKKLYEAVTEPDIKNRKMVDIRKNDRGFLKGDYLLLQEYDEIKQEYTGKETLRLVTHILNQEPWVPSGYVAMSLFSENQE
jgi:hypothetical protein